MTRRKFHISSLLIFLFISHVVLTNPASAANCTVSTTTSGSNTIVLITTTGSCTFIIPANVTSMKVESWGAGGGSKGQDDLSGAGAGGAYALSNISVTAGSTLYVSVGTGGIGSQISGTAGGDSWVNLSNSAPTNSSTGVLAKGGAGAPVSSPNNSTQFAQSIGTTIYIGGAGGTGAEGGGGAGASSFGNGGAGAVGNGGAGGSSPGAGSGGSAGLTTLNGGDGISNVEGGGGGGGSYNNRGGMGGSPGGSGGAGYTNSSVNPSSGVNTNSVHGFGGDGGRGQVRLTYISAPDLTPPTFPSAETFNTAENTTSVGTITASESATITIFGGEDQAKFSISRLTDSSTALSFITAPDFEAPTDVGANNTYIVVFRAVDSASNAGYENVTVTVTDVVDTSAFNSFALAGSVTTATYRTTIQITANVTVAAKVTFRANNLRIPGCINVRTTGTSPNIVAVCNWKPSRRGPLTLTASAAPTGAGISGSSSTPISIFVNNRTTPR